MNLSELTFDEFSGHGIDYCSCVSGGGIMYLVDALGENNRIIKKYFHHEQAAGIASEAYTKATNRPALCLSTIGPGVANAVSAAFSAYLNSAPVIFLSGAKRTTVPVHYPTQRFTFPQDADTRSLVSGVVKAYWEIQNEAQVCTVISEAIHVATEGRPGPVWISIPLDLQAVNVSPRKQLPLVKKMPHKNIFKELSEFIHRSKRTVILTGSGADSALDNFEYVEFIKKIGLPCITSIGSGHTIQMAGDLDLGTFGPVGRRSANRILVEADSLLVLGSGLDIDITGFDRESFFSGKEVFIINSDPRILIKEASKVTYVTEKLNSINFSAIKEIESLQENWVSYAKLVNKLLSTQFEIKFHSSESMSGVDPYLFASRLGALLPEKSAIALGISLDVVSVSHSMPLKSGSRTFASKHCGQLGWDIPASIGLADSGIFERVVCVTGDGSIMFNLQDLATLSKSKVPVHIYVYDNKGYNSIRISQQTHLNGRLHGSDLNDLVFPDWKLIAQAFGYEYIEISNDSEINQKVRSHEGIKNLLCVVKIDEERSRTPRLVSKLADGKFQSPSLSEQFPYLDDEMNRELKELKKRYL